MLRFVCVCACSDEILDFSLRFLTLSKVRFKRQQLEQSNVKLNAEHHFFVQYANITAKTELSPKLTSHEANEQKCKFQWSFDLHAVIKVKYYSF